MPKLRASRALDHLPEAPLYFGVFLVAYFASFSFIDSFIFISIITIQSWAGGRIVRRLAPEHHNPYFLFSVGILVSSIIFTVANQLLVHVENGAIFACLIVAILGLCGRGRGTRQVIPVRSQFDLLATILVIRGLQGAWWAIVLAFALLAFRFQWLRIGGQKSRSNLVLLSGFLIICIAMSFEIKRAQWWWWFPSSNDAGYFEALSTTLARFGPFEHPGLLGGSVIGYHWLAYGWVGAFSEVVTSPPWFGLAVYLPIVTLLIGVCLVYSIVEVLTGSPETLATTSTSLMVFVPSATFIVSAWFGNLWVLAICVYIVEFVRIRSLRSPAAMIALLSAGAVFSKGTNLIVVMLIAGLGSIVLIGQHKLKFAVHTIVSAGSVCISGYLYFASGIGPRFVERVSLTCELGEILPCATESIIANKSSLAIASLLVLLFGVARRIQHQSFLKVLVIGVSGSQILVVMLLRRTDVQEYLLQSLDVLGLVLIASASLIIIKRSSFSDLRGLGAARSIIFGLLSGSLSASVIFLSSAGFLNEKSIGIVDQKLVLWMRDFFDKWWGISVAVISILFLLWRYRKDLTKNLTQIGVLLSVLFLGFGLGEGAAGSSLRYLAGPDAFIESDDNSAVMPSPDLVEVAEIVRTSTKFDYVLATNNFCCDGTAWLDNQLQEIRRHPELESESWPEKYGGANYLIPAVTQRRTLASGLKFTTARMPSDSVIHMMRSSLEFANTPSLQTMTELCELGADGALINLSLTSSQEWSGPGVVRASIGDFVFVDFTDCR